MVPMVAAGIETDGGSAEFNGAAAPVERGCGGVAQARLNFLVGGREMVGRGIVSSLVSLVMVAVSGWTDTGVGFCRILGSGGFGNPEEGRAKGGICAGVGSREVEHKLVVKAAVMSKLSSTMVLHILVGGKFNSGGIVAPIDWLAW